MPWVMQARIMVSTPAGIWGVASTATSQGPLPGTFPCQPVATQIAEAT